MSDDVITRLVVGEPMKVVLGVPVGQRMDAGATSSALRWNDGDWVDSASSKLSKALNPKTFKAPLRRIALEGRSAWHKHAAMGVAIVAAISVGALATILWRGSADSSLTIAQAGASVEGPVKVVTAPYAPAPRNPGGLPIAAFSAAAPEGDPGAVENPAPRLARKVPVAAPSAQVATAPTQAPAAAKVPHQKADKEEPASRVPAVLLDDPTPAAAQRATPPAAAPTGKVAASANTAVVAKADQPTKPPPAKGTGLVAITPDGKSAVFTNPKTRLPEQFKVGDVLPSGETVRSVDYREGRVVTSSKEYGLE